MSILICDLQQTYFRWIDDMGFLVFLPSIIFFSYAFYCMYRAYLVYMTMDKNDW